MEDAVTKQIYRGYDIAYDTTPSQDENPFVISHDGKELARVATENAAYGWIDAEKRKQSAGR